MSDKGIQVLAECGMANLDALADSWAEDVDLTSMIKDAMSPLDRCPRNSDDALRNQIESRVYAIVRQAFQEGALGAIASLSDERLQLRALGAFARPLKRHI